MRARPPSSLWSSKGSSSFLFKSRYTLPRQQLGHRYIQVHAVPAASRPTPENEIPLSAPTTKNPAPDARFEVLGAPYSLLSVELSASQNLYTRRGTLVAVNGKAENAVSTLSVLEPFRRAIVGIPFLYQRISSTSPISALLSTKSPITSFAVVHLDGRLDWVVAQRNALLAWTGHALSVKPKFNTSMSLAHWGQSHITGRGLLALVGKGQIYQVHLKAGEEYIVHPGNVVAYTVNQTAPQPYRFKSSVLRFQIPTSRLGALIPDVRFFHEIAKTTAWKALAQLSFNLRTWARRSIWGDRLFLRFNGPSTILLQSRGSRITDVLTSAEVNEIADTPAGSVQSAIKLDLQKAAKPATGSVTAIETPTEPTEKLRYATVGQDGKVDIKNS